MRATDVLSLAFKGIRQRKLRTAITILSVVIGVAAIIALVSQTSGIQASITGELQSLGPTSIIIIGGRTQLSAATVADIETLQHVQTVIPMITSSFTLTVSGTSTTVPVIGVDSQSIQSLLGSIKLGEGSVYTDTTAPVAVVGYSVTFPTGGSQTAYVGQPLLLTQTVGTSTRSITMVVVGLLDQYGSSSFISPDTSIFIPISAMESILNRNYYNEILVKADNVNDVSSVQTQLSDIYGSSVTIISVASISSSVSSIISLLSLLLGAIAAISLIVAGVGIMNIQLVSVYERIHEIGIMKAIGFKDRNILSLFLSESAIIGILGGIFGILLGAGVSSLIPIILSSLVGSSGIGQSATATTAAAAGGGTVVARGGGGGFGGGASGFGGGGGFGGGASGFASGSLSYTPVISPEIVFISLIIAISVSIIAGLYPAWRASRMEPVKALRYE
ncbi:MAG: ABC transporter permease [Nitrososphaeria archaeon]|jgi:ABC-type antimicrobial peptide transport system permease subunit